MNTLIEAIPKNSLEEVRVELTEYQGHDLVGLRIYSGWLEDGVMRPTRKGITVSVELLPDIIEALQKAKQTLENCGNQAQEPLQKEEQKNI